MPCGLLLARFARDAARVLGVFCRRSRPTRRVFTCVGHAPSLTACVVLVGAAAAGIGGAAQTTGGTEARVRAAVIAAVQSRLGGAADVTVGAITCAIANERDGELVATPDPTSRLGTSMRFVLAARDRSGPLMRIGQASAVVRVSADSVRTRRTVARGTVLTGEDVEAARGPLGEIALRPLLSLADAIGARAPHDLPSGQTLTTADVAVVPAVKSGDRVRAVVRVDGVEASMTAIAVEGGPTGRIIRIVNADSHRTLRARITGSGEVEVMHEE